MEQGLLEGKVGDEKLDGHQYQEDVGVMDGEETKSITLEGLLEENKGLKATVEELRSSLEKKDDKIRKQKKTLRVLKRTFMLNRDNWNKITKWRQTLERLLAEVLKEEEGLIEIVEGLKQAMDQAGKAVREKEEEARKLFKKMARLEEGSGINNLKGAAKDNKTIHSDGRLAVDILPEEVWKIILGKVSDPKDLWNCCNTSQLFETLLRPWKTGWMLEQALPHLYRHLPGSKLLECRQVSKGWYAGVTRFLDSHPSLQPHSDEGSDPRRLDVVYPVKEKGIGSRNFFNFGPDEDLSRSHELFPSRLGQNPFIGRYVGLHLREPDGPEDMDEVYDIEEERWAKLYSFLDAYGKEIWHLALYFPLQPGPRTVDKICELLTAKLFPLVPNLRKLFMTGTGCDMEMPIDHEALPLAPDLKILQVGRVGEDKVVDSLIRRYHLQLEGLHVSESTWQFVRHLDWPCLKDFAIYLKEDEWEVDLGSIHGLTIPRLSRLTLRCEDFINLYLPSLTVAINELTFTSSLNAIRLAGPLQCLLFGQGWQTNSFVLGAVKTLELIDHWTEHFTSLPCHNFLRCFPLIENLTVIVRKASSYRDILQGRFETESDLMPDDEWKRRAAGLAPVHEFVEVNKYAYVGQMYKSNIWVLLPRLKVLTFQWDVYTRSGYEAYKRSHPRINAFQVGSECK